MNTKLIFKWFTYVFLIIVLVGSTPAPASAKPTESVPILSAPIVSTLTDYSNYLSTGKTAQNSLYTPQMNALVNDRINFYQEFSDGNALSEFEQLKADIAEIESLVNRDNFQEFYKQNKEWIRNVNTRLEEYMAVIPKDQRTIVMKELRGEDPYIITGVSDYFYSTEYHYRGGYWTYSLDPKIPVRLWAPSAQAGWEALAGIYYYIAMSPPGSSLHDQYWCHFDLVFADIWDIERGRPDVSYFDTLVALCNPDGGD